MVWFKSVDHPGYPWQIFGSSSRFVFEYKKKLIVPTKILAEYTVGTRQRRDPGPGDGWLP
jgi:hypothetical protein